MNKYYILNINPQASSDWDLCVLRNPITGDRPDLTNEIAQILNKQAGSYLVRVSLQVEVLEQKIEQPISKVDLPIVKRNRVTKVEKVAC